MALSWNVVPKIGTPSLHLTKNTANKFQLLATMTQPVKTHPNFTWIFVSNLHPIYSHKFLWNFHITYTAPLKSHIKTSKAATSTVYFPTLGIASTQTRRRGLGDGAGFPKAFHSPQNWCCLRCSMFVRLGILQNFQVSSNRRYTPNTSGGTSLLVLLQDWCHLFHIFCAVTSNFLMAMTIHACPIRAKMARFGAPSFTSPQCIRSIRTIDQCQ